MRAFLAAQARFIVRTAWDITVKGVLTAALGAFLLTGVTGKITALADAPRETVQTVRAMVDGIERLVDDIHAIRVIAEAEYGAR